MLGLLLIYFIGKAFYELAHDYKKSRWGFAILGIISYYTGTFLGGIILGIIGALANSNFPQDLPNIVLSLLAIPFGLLTCWVFYKILVGQWNKKEQFKNYETLDGNVVE